MIQKTIALSEPTEEINSRILKVSEDLLEGFYHRPFHEIALQCDLPVETVLERIRLMLSAGTVRRVRQTLLATKLAEGALAAWKVPADKLQSAFRFMVDKDPFSGHVVTRSTDANLPGAQYNLWTTLKVPQGESLNKHAIALQKIVGAEKFCLMPAKGVFTLGVGHMRRRGLLPGAKADDPSTMVTTQNVTLTEIEWKVLLKLKFELALHEITERPWDQRAHKIGLSSGDFEKHAQKLDEKGVIGRFSTFLEHVKPSATGKKVTRYNGLFHWGVPKGMEQQAGSEIGRHFCMTHCYWREGGPDFGDVNIMGVVHGTDKDLVLEHKAAIDAHLKSCGIPLLYTNVFWGGHSEIKPSEISPIVYREWHQARQKKNSATNA